LSVLPDEEGNSAHLFENAKDHDWEDDIFLDLDDLNDPAFSGDSSKKRKLEEGDESSSHSFTK